ncbi:MAG: hypothetical protein EAZ57_01875 [Cytophagales bacterium]|nr:MAG: hypothetical protein EAZ67_02715 [Cytophagales bacterium]TAF61872.1 MAG: hypothetical protein EAZ57_01875 [Cytophagales bacterium]
MKMIFFYSYLLLVFLSTTSLWAQERAGMAAYIKAETLREQGNYAKAILEYDAAIAKEPQNLLYKTTKCQCYLNMFEVKQAIVCFEGISREHPKDTSAVETLANLHATAQSLDNAILYFEKAAALSTSEDYKLSCYLNILNMLHIQNKMRKAGRYIQEAQKSNPKHFDLLFMEAEYSNIIGQYEKALVAIDSVIKQLPKDNAHTSEFSKFYYQRTISLFNMGRYAEMKEAAKHVTDASLIGLIKFYTSEYQQKMGEAYFKNYLYDKSLTALTLAIRIDSSNAKARMLRADIYKIQSELTKTKLTEVERTWKEDLPNDKKSPRLAELAMLHFNSANYIKSLERIQEYLTLNPLQHDMYILQAAANLLIKKPELVIEQLEPLTKVDKVSNDVKNKSFMLMGMAHYDTKDYRKAYGFFKKASYGDYAEVAGWYMKDIREHHDLDKEL